MENFSFYRRKNTFMKKNRTRACTCKKKVVSLHANWGGTIQSTEQKHEGKQRFHAFTEAKRTRNNAVITP